MLKSYSTLLRITAPSHAKVAALNPNNEAPQNASSIGGLTGGVRWVGWLGRVRRMSRVRRVRLGPLIQGCMARSMGFNTAVATWHRSCFIPALAHLSSYCKDFERAQMRQREVLTTTLSMFSSFKPNAFLLACHKIAKNVSS